MKATKRISADISFDCWTILHMISVKENKSIPKTLEMIIREYNAKNENNNYEGDV